MNSTSVSLATYSSLRVGGEGELIVVKNSLELQEALSYARSVAKQVHIIGGGTNSYFGNDLSAFLFIKPEFLGVSFTEQGDVVHVIASATENWDDLVARTVEKGLWGIENLSRIPGTVGAAPVQNIGAYGVELASVFVSLTAFDVITLQLVTFTRDECLFCYRDSVFKQQKGRYIITDVTFALSKIPHPILTYKPLDVLLLNEAITPADVRDVVIRTREAKLPDYEEYPNAGSFFKNPVVSNEVLERVHTDFPGVPGIETDEGYKIPAAWLIEHVAEMKGVQVGDMGTWPNQPLVLVNYGNATADDVDAIASQIKSRVYEKTGIRLEQEVNRVG